MALNSTMYVFTVRLADADRNTYETLTRIDPLGTEATNPLSNKDRVFGSQKLEITGFIVETSLAPQSSV